jgi:Flavin reductase like domain
VSAKSVRRAKTSPLRELPLGKVYQAIEPGPVVLLATAESGRANVMTMSWHMMVDFEPPLIACIVSEGDYSYAALCATRECVIAIPAVELAGKVVEIGNSSGRDIDKFAAFGLTKIKAKRVGAPLIAECFVNLECKVKDTTLVDKYGLFIFKWSKPGRTPSRKRRGPSTTRATARSSSTARRSRWSRGCVSCRADESQVTGFGRLGRFALRWPQRLGALSALAKEKGDGVSAYINRCYCRGLGGVRLCKWSAGRMHSLARGRRLPCRHMEADRGRGSRVDAPESKNGSGRRRRE